MSKIAILQLIILASILLAVKVQAQPSQKPPIVTREEWGASPPRCQYARNPYINAITIHHTATSNTYSDAKEVVRSIQRFHQEERGWCDIGYHYLIDREGVIYEGRPLWAVGAHVKNHNKGNIGIALIGNYEEASPTPEQLKALTALISWLVYKYKIPLSNIKGHRDYAETLCPGKHLYALLPYIRRKVGSETYGFGDGYAVAAWWAVYSDQWSTNSDEWEKQVEETLAFLKEIGVDTVFFMAKDPWGYVYYNSSIAPLNPKYSWDPLKIVVEKAKKYNISVHAYINVYAEGESKPSPYLQKHLEWALRDEEGNPIGWVDPSSGQYKERILKIIEEILENYDVDGIQLDRIRIPSSAARLPVTEKKYAEKPSGAKSALDYASKQVTSLIKEAYALVKRIKPAARLSAAVIANPQTAREQLCQDWPAWIKEQQIDFVVPMSYTTNQQKFQGYVESAVQATGGVRPIYMGIGAYKAPDPQTFGQQIILAKQYDDIYGAVIFNVDTLIKNKQLWSSLKTYITQAKHPQQEAKPAERESPPTILYALVAALIITALAIAYKLLKA